MAGALSSVDLGSPAAGFRLPATDGRTYALSDVAGEHGTVIVFICNHCPYVKAVIDRLVVDARALKGDGIGFAAICSNDATAYPEDSFANMTRFASAHGFTFPYLHDEDQSVARAYGAACTPDFFGYDAAGKLRYRGRLDVAPRRRRRARAGRLSRRCAPSPRPASGPPSNSRRSVAPSSGKPNSARPAGGL